MPEVIERYLASLRRELEGMVPPETVNATIQESREHLESSIEEGLTPEEAVRRFGSAKRLARQLSRSYRPHTPFWKAVAVTFAAVLAIEGGAGISQVLGFPQVMGYQLIEVIVYGTILVFGIWCYRTKRVQWAPIATVAALYGLSFYALNARLVPVAGIGGGHYLLTRETIRKTALESRAQIPLLEEAKRALDAGQGIVNAAKFREDLGIYGKNGEYKTPQFFYDKASPAMWGLPSILGGEAANPVPFVFSRTEMTPVHVHPPTVKTLLEAQDSWKWGPGAASFVDFALRVNRGFISQASRLEKNGYAYDFLGQSEVVFRYAFGMFFWLMVVNLLAVFLSKIEVRRRRPWPTTLEAASS